MDNINNVVPNVDKLAENVDKKEEKKHTLEEMKQKDYKFTQDILSAFQYAFCRDYTDAQACRYAKINPDTFYRWLRESDEFRAFIETAKDDLKVKAKENIRQRVVVDKDTETSKYVLERREKENYSPRQENINADTTLEELKEILRPPE